MKFSTFALSAVAAAAIAVLRAHCSPELRQGRHDSRGRWRADVSVEEHHRERGELQGPHHAGRRGEGRRPRRDALGPGPFTVFAPTNEAFAKLPAGTVETLLKPENKDALVDVLTYHVVAGPTAMSDAIAKMNGGKAMIKTVEAAAHLRR